MKRNKLLSRGTALLLALALTLGLCPVSLAAGRSLTLRSLEDLTAFAKNCASDRYSDGLTVRLAADIDAEGTAVSIPLFLGTFEGQGHSISGLRLTESNSAYGLFSRVETGAAVRDLTVEAEVTPSGEQSRVGGIAGENAGSIENCAFSGVVVGSAAVGGIAGYNEGTIQDCSASGVIRGTQYAGGIAGQNAGTLLRCENRAAVNTTVTEEDITAAELEELESTLYRLLKREEVTETAVTTDSGGIAGFSTGVIQSCTNRGSVGYAHVGYNVGGIAGSGSRVTDCLSLVEITEAAQQSGAIAGEITGDYQGNRFVSETLAGVDRVSLSGKAEAVSYDQLAALDAAPENFRRLTLRFVADGRTLKEQTFDYGASFPESAYPDAPEKDGCYVHWDRESLHELHFDTTVTAVYEPYVTTLSSDPQDAHPALLVEGKFRLGERMEAQQSTSPVPGSGSLVETWTLTLPEDGEASHTVRWRLPDTEETYTVYLKEDGAWRKTESETIGSYLRFDLPAGAQFAVAPAASRPWQLWALAGAGCAGIAVVLLLFLRKRKTKGPKESECELQTEAH